MSFLHFFFNDSVYYYLLVHNKKLSRGILRVGGGKNKVFIKPLALGWIGGQREK
jgi:hypothetical protein